jgi:hypothetical protein
MTNAVASDINHFIMFKLNYKGIPQERLIDSPTNQLKCRTSEKTPSQDHVILFPRSKQ